MQQNKIIDKIQSLLKEKESVIIAIDGRCGAGKTTLAGEIAQMIECNLIHMDDFFLRKEQRSEERLATPGGNVDYERFIEEVLIALKGNQPFSYRPYVCRTMSFGDAVNVTPKTVTVVEGSYSCHPEMWEYYDLHIFLDIDKDEQMRRIINRNGEDGAKMFKDKWIPLEEKYFKTFSIKEKCELKF